MSQVCYQLHQLVNRLPIIKFPFDNRRIPQNGIYILFEIGETGHGFNRIVRIGTHTGNDKLLSRLKEHFIRENKDRSIFRKNIGRAILNRASDPFLEQWNLDLTSHDAKQKYNNVVDFPKQNQIEQQVTEYIQNNFSFAVFRLDNKKERLAWESKLISTVSQCNECKQSKLWLGNFSPMIKIKESGLWNVQELNNKILSDEDYIELKKVIT